MMMIYPSLAGLTSDAKIADLATHDFRVSTQTLGHQVAHEFKQQPELPGVLVVDGPVLAGMISRQKFLEFLSRPFGLELFMKRPIKTLLDAIDMPPLELEGTLGIHEAVQRAMSRPADQVYEPVVVVGEEPRLLSISFLLLAQSHQMALARDVIQQQKEGGRRSQPSQERVSGQHEP